MLRQGSSCCRWCQGPLPSCAAAAQTQGLGSSPIFIYFFFSWKMQFAFQQHFFKKQQRVGAREVLQKLHQTTLVMAAKFLLQYIFHLSNTKALALSRRLCTELDTSFLTFQNRVKYQVQFTIAKQVTARNCFTKPIFRGCETLQWALVASLRLPTPWAELLLPTPMGAALWNAETACVPAGVP